MLSRILLVLLVLVTGSACTNALEELRQTHPLSSIFHSRLSQHYLEFAEKEAKNYDWISSNHFAKKGLRASRGEIIDPEDSEDWSIPKGMRPTLIQARDYLVSALDEHTIRNHPELAADAIFYYDCWVEEQAENNQPAEILNCKEKFYTSLDDLFGALVGAGPAKQNDAAYTLFFDFNSAKIKKEAEMLLDKLIQELKGKEHYEIVLNGHADRAGTEAYNMLLSKRRAEAVKQRLIKGGIPAKSMKVYAFGETDPKVPTKDGVRNPQNRRVEIFLGE